MVTNTLEALLADGSTERMAKEYLAQLEFEKQSPMFDDKIVAWAHSRGFFAESALAYGLTDNNRANYLSDYDYARLWPLNEWQRVWINDKLTLKYLMAGTELDKYLPKYYYYTRNDGLLPLVDAPKDSSIEGLVALLREVGEIACKPNNGAMAKGFHRLSFKNGSTHIDGVVVNKEALVSFVSEHPNYVFTEFLRPHSKLAEIDPLIHTLRVLVLNTSGLSPEPVAAYIRFAIGSDKSGNSPNYIPPTRADICSYNLNIDLETGRLSDGAIVYANRVTNSFTHPDSGATAIIDLPFWSDTRFVIDAFGKALPAVEYLGFDLCITGSGPRVIEINSHSGIKYLQLFTPLATHPVAGPYFSEKLRKLNTLDKPARAQRALILR